jgi:hypothetical protein
MRRKIFLLARIAIIAYLSCSGCGGGTSSSTISDKVWYDVGISIPMSSTDPRSCKMDVDAFADTCQDGTFLVDHTTPATVTLTRVDPTVDPGHLFIDHYTIQYIPMQANSPAIPPMSVYQTQQLNEGDNTVTLMVMDVQRKTAFASLFASGQQYTSGLPAGYTAAYTFYGSNSYGETWTYDAQAPIYVGEYNECAPCQ